MKGGEEIYLFDYPSEAKGEDERSSSTMGNFKETFQETIERLKKTGAKTKGDLLSVADDYLKEIGKEEALSQVLQKTAVYGYPIQFEEMRVMKWYPVAMEMALFFALIEVLDWDEKEIKEFGKNFVKLSFLEKIMTKYFISTEKTYQAAPTIWRRHMDSGVLETPEFNKKGKYCILRLKGLDLHPLYCIFLSGMFETMAVYITKAKKNWCDEAKCTFKGDSYHEFIVRWE